MADDLKDEIKLSVDASGVETGVSRAKRSIDSLGQSVQDAGKKGGDGLNQIGAGGARAAQDLDASTRRIVSSLERQIVATRAGGTATREYQETMAKLRGANMDVLRPYLDQLEKVQQETRKATGATEGFMDAARGMGNLLGGLAVGLASAFSLRTFIAETVAAEQEQAQLAAVLKSTGNAAGYSREQLNRMAEEMAKASNFSAGQINVAQTRLLSYTGIVGTQFPRAMQAASDMAARMGMDLSSAAETIGRALDVPSQGLTALTRQGFRFTEEQKAMVEQMEATGRTAEAQGMILAALETSYGGAAAAARDTLGGALTALKENINSLMTGEGGSVEELRKGIEEVNTALGSPQTQAAFQKFLGWLATVSAAAIQGAANLMAFVQANDKLAIVAGTDNFGKMKSSAADLTAQIVRLTDRAERFQEAINRGDNVAQNQRNLDKTRQRIAELQKQAMEASQKLKDFANDAAKTATAPILGPDLPVSAPGAAGPKAKDVKRAADELRREMEAQAKLFAELSGLSSSFAEDWERLNKAFKEGKLTVEQLTEAQARLLEKQPGIKAAMQEEAKARDEALKIALRSYDEEQKAQVKLLQSRQAAAENAQRAVQAARDEAEAHAIAAAEGITLAEAIAQIAVARAEETYQKELASGADGATLLALQKEIEARKELVGLIRTREVRRATEDGAKKAAQEWERTSQEIERSLTDALLRGFESGKDFAENFRDTLKSMFNTLVLRPIISAIVQPVSLVINGLTQSVLGGMGLGGGGGGILGMASNANMLYNGYSLLGGGVGGNMGALSGLWGGSMSGANAFGSIFANSVSATGATDGLSALLMTNNAYGTGAGGAAAGAGWAAAGYAAIAGLILNAMGAFRSDAPVGAGLRGTLGKGDIRPYELWREGGTLFDGPNYSINDRGAEIERLEADLRELIAAGQGTTEAAYNIQRMLDALKGQYGDQIEAARRQGKAIDDAFIALRENTLRMGDVLGLSTEHLKDWTTQLGTDLIHPDTGGVGIDFADLDSDGIAKKIAEALATANNELAEQLIGSWVTTTETITRVVERRPPTGGDTDIPGIWDTVEETVTSTRYVASEYAREGEKAIDTLTRLATSLQTVNTVFDQLGLNVLEASLASGDLASRFADLFGGLENFQQASATYYANFYSDDERRDYQREQLDKMFDDLGLERIDYDDPEARKRYRELVEREQQRMLDQQAGLRAVKGNLDTVLGDLKPLQGGERDVRSMLGDVLGEAGELTQEDLDRLNGAFQSFDAGALSMDGLKESITELLEPVVGVGTSAEETVAALLGASGAFAQVTQSADQAAEASRRAAEEAAREAERKRQEAIRSAYDLFRRAVDRDRRELQDQASGIEDVIATISGAVDLLKSSARDLYGTVDSTAQMLAAQGMVYIEQALGGMRAGGSLVDYDRLDEAIGAARGGISNGAYASQFERDRDTLVLAGQLSELGELGDLQLSVEERQLKAINAQIEHLDNLAKRADELVNGTAALNGTVDSYFRALIGLLTPDKPSPGTGGASGSPEEVIGGTEGSPKPPAKNYAPGQRTEEGNYVKEVILGAGMSSFRETTAEETKYLDSVAAWMQKYVGTGDVEGMLREAKSIGYTMLDLSTVGGWHYRDLVAAGKRLGIPQFAVGTNYVPRDMVAQIHQGEAIVPKAFNPWAGGQGMQAGNAELVAEVRALREDNRAQAGQIVRLQSDIAKMLQRWDGNGLPEQREEALA